MENFWEFGHYLFLFLLWVFLVTVMTVANCQGTRVVSFSMQMDYNEVRSDLEVPLATILGLIRFLANPPDEEILALWYLVLKGRLG
jgi:hypothetical protein